MARSAGQEKIFCYALNMEVTPETEQLPIAVEAARPEDAEAMVRVCDQAWIETYPNDAAGISEGVIRERVQGKHGERFAQKAQRYRELIKTQDADTHAAFVARQGDEVVGISLPYVEEQDGQRRHRLGALYTLKKVHGQGAGAEILKKTLDWHGPHDVWLHVAAYNERAIRFYEKHGFERTGVVVPDELAKSDNVHIPQIEMVRRHQSNA